MEIHVTQQHIDAGEPKDHHNCAISLALKDAGIPLAMLWDKNTGFRDGVDAQQINCPDGYTILLTAEMREFVRDFDVGKEFVGPITFEFPDATFQAVKVEAPADLVTV